MRRFAIVAVLLAMASPAMADEPVPTPPVKPVAPTDGPVTSAAPAPTIPCCTLRVTPEQANVIGSALGALPYAQVAPLYAELTQQVRDQQKAGK